MINSIVVLLSITAKQSFMTCKPEINIDLKMYKQYINSTIFLAVVCFCIFTGKSYAQQQSIGLLNDTSQILQLKRYLTNTSINKQGCR